MLWPVHRGERIMSNEKRRRENISNGIESLARP